jgi:heme-degrading monooxygenase HmoA
MYLMIWEFRVSAESCEGFERLYGPEGGWARLFRTGSGYLGTELVRDQDDPERYLTLDRWISRADHDAFRASHAAEYEALDREGETLTASERKIGAFTAERNLVVPARAESLRPPPFLT